MKKLPLVLILLLLLSTPAFSQNDKMGAKVIENELYTPTTSEEARQLYNQGGDYLDEKNYEKAVSSFKRALAIDASYIDAYDNLGLAYRKMNELDSAERYYLISRRKYPKGAVAVMNLAVVEEKRGNYQKAVNYYELLLTLRPDDAEAYYGLMRQYMLLEKYDKALENAQITERMYKASNNPHIGDCYLTMCILYIMTNNKEMGRKYMGLAREAGMTIAPQLEEALK